MYFNTAIISVAMLSVLLSKCASYRSPVGLRRITQSVGSTALFRAENPGKLSTTRYLSNKVDRIDTDSNSRNKMVDNARMDERIHKAENWVTMQLSDKEAAEFNKVLGIESEVMDALAEGKRKGERDSKRAQNALQKLKGVGERQYQEGRVKGFLEQNPYLCPGCGAPFQARSPDTPGFLPKEIFHEHRKRSELTKQTQEAVKLLDMAGLDLDSPAAVDALRKGRVSEEVIRGVQSIAQKSRLEAEQSAEKRTSSEYNKDEATTNSAANRPKTVYFDEVTQAYETIHPQAGVVDLLQPMSLEELDAYKNRYAKFNKNKAKTAKEATIVETTASAASPVKSWAVPAGGSEAEGVGEAAHRASLLDDTSVCICQRCYKLQNYGQVDSALRPGWSADELLTPERFEKLLGTIKDTPSVVLCLVDIFDLRGSILKNLRQIVGTNPVVIAANKVDLLPQDVSMMRLTSWIHSEVKQTCGFSSPPGRDNGDRNKADFDLESYLDEQDSMHFGTSRKDSKYEYAKTDAAKPSKEEREANYLRRNNVHLVSCQTGMGMDKLLADLMEKAALNGKKIHVMGAANVGKSSFINRLLENAKLTINTRHGGKAGKLKIANKNTPMATVSNLPGTTLDFIKLKLPNGVTMIDTPGLLSASQLTSKLNGVELKQVIPEKEIKPLTLRVQEGKCVLIGGMARVELLEGRPFFFTFFVSNEVKLHSTTAAKADEIVQKHLGSLLAPPATVERYNEIGPYVTQDLEISGEGWKKSSYDIVIAGLGWVSVTGPGTAKVRITVPEGTSVGLRPSLLPYEAPLTTVKFSGGRMMRKGAVKRVKSDRNVDIHNTKKPASKEGKVNRWKDKIPSKIGTSGRSSTSGGGSSASRPSTGVGSRPASARDWSPVNSGRAGGSGSNAGAERSWSPRSRSSSPTNAGRDSSASRSRSTSGGAAGPSSSNKWGTSRGKDGFGAGDISVRRADYR